MYECTYVRTYVRTNVRTYVCMYVCTCMYDVWNDMLIQCTRYLAIHRLYLLSYVLSYNTKQSYADMFFENKFCLLLYITFHYHTSISRLQFDNLKKGAAGLHTV